MVNLDMSLSELTARAYARALPARKWGALASKWLDSHRETSPGRENEVTRALFTYLPDPPALILAYLSHALATNLITARTATIHLLFHIDEHPIPSETLSSISAIILANPTGLDASDPLPSSLPALNASPPPDIGPSSPPPPQSTWTLSLLLPLLRICTDKSCTSPVIQLVSRVLSIVAPYPAPPFDVGLEASQLMGSLPDTISMPLRESLSGLMADLAISEGTQAQLQSQAQTQAILPSGPKTTGTAQSFGAPETKGPRLCSLYPPDVYADTQPQALAILLASYRQQRQYDRNPSYSSTPPRPPKGLLDILKVAWTLTTDGDRLLSDLLSVAVDQISGEAFGVDGKGVDGWVLLVEDLPTLLRRWKDQPGSKTQFPTNLASCIKGVLDAKGEFLNNHAAWQQATLERLTSHSDGESDEGAFTPPDGWSYASIREGLVRRLADLDLLSVEDVEVVLPGLSVGPPWLNNGESLLQRVSSASKPHLEALAMIITYSPGAARSFAAEFIQTIQACPAVQPPENLFLNLSSSPALLASLSAYCPPSTMLDLLVASLIDRTEDPSIRSEDPQGSMTRFGEGAILVETFVAQYGLPLPPLLKEARVSLTLSELDTEERSMINGWVKALFGSDGIDDEILLSTIPPNLCRLGCGLFQQAITATAVGQIDLDTLHSGLSYFSQPLLSWSLGGIVTWLCREAHRHGSLAALHLDLLQNLLLASALPDGLLRATGPDIASLFAPHAGLQAVIKSSGFDVDAVKNKLEFIGVATVTLPTDINALGTLRTNLQTSRQPESASADWAPRIISSLHSAARLESPLACLGTIISELTLPYVLDPNTIMDDPLARHAPLLLVTPLLPNGPTLLEVLLGRYLPPLLDSASPTFPLGTEQSRSLARLLRLGLLVLDGVDPVTASRLVGGLVQEIKYQRARGVEVDRQAIGGANKKRKAVGGLRPLGAGASELVNVLSQAFDDEPTKGRWAALSEL